MGALPERTVEYNGYITEGKRWQDYRHRADDIFVGTPAKSGTTWTQALCAMLLFGRADIDVQPGTISPWYDANFTPPEAVNAMLEGQTHRRFVKTHTPLDGLPFFSECTYLAVYRDPRDVFFSFSNHLGNIKKGFTENVAPADPRQGFVQWCREPWIDGRAEQFSLASPLYHLKSFWAWRHLPNVHLFHYSDMKRDLVRSTRELAQALGIRLDDDAFAAIARAGSFEHMREHASQFAPGAGSGMWKSDAEFFNKGRQGQWRDVLGEGELAVYREAVAANLPPDAASWIENGGTPPSA